MFFRNTFKKIENIKLNLFQVFFWIFSIITIRYLLENIIFSQFPTFSIIIYLAQSFFFIALMLLFIVLISLFTKTEILKVSKVVGVFLPIILLPVLTEGIILGNYTKFEYLTVSNTKDFIVSYLTFFYKYVPIGITIELLLIFISLLLYIYFKTEKIFKSIISTIVIYYIVALIGFLPMFLSPLISSKEAFNSFIKVPTNIGFHGVYGNVYFFSSIIFLILISLLSGIWFYLYNNKKFSLFFKKQNFLKVFLFAALIGFFIKGGRNIFDLIVLFFLVFFTYQFVSLTQKDLSYILTKKEILNLSVLFFLISIFFSYAIDINIKIFFLILILNLLSLFHLVKSKKFKKYFSVAFSIFLLITLFFVGNLVAAT